MTQKVNMRKHTDVLTYGSDFLALQVRWVVFSGGEPQMHTDLARLGQVPAVAPGCNAPWVSALIETDGTVRPCFFHRSLGNIHQNRIVASSFVFACSLVSFRKLTLFIGFRLSDRKLFHRLGQFPQLVFKQRIREEAAAVDLHLDQRLVSQILLSKNNTSQNQSHPQLQKAPPGPYRAPGFRQKEKGCLQIPRP